MAQGRIKRAEGFAGFCLRPTLVTVRRSTCRSTPHLHTETGYIREMLKVIRDQSHAQGYRV